MKKTYASQNSSQDHCKWFSVHLSFTLPRPSSSAMYKTNRIVIIHRRTKTENFLPELNTISQSSMAHQVENNTDNSVYCYIG